MKHLVQNKKALSMALAAALAIAPVNAFAASNDIRGHWAERTITQWQDKGLIGGYQDGTFKPDKPATRAEFARIMNQALGLNHKGNVSFSDVSSSDWFYNDVAIAMGEQYTAGYPDGTFKPNEIITRAQAAVFIAKALGASGGSLASFKDASSIPAWAQGAIGGIVEKGYMSGYPDGTFRPNAVLTRAEAVSTLNRIMGVKPVEEETKKVEKDVIIDQSGTKLKDQTIEGNLTISDKVGNGKVTLSNVEIKGDLIIQGGGENSVYLDNTTVAGKTVMDKKNVRLELSGKTKLPNVEIKKACNLTTSNFSGEVKRITITSSISDKTTIGVAAEKLYVESKADLYITKDIDQVVVEKDAAGTKIEVGSNSKVSTLTADGKISLNGKGKVSTLEANVDGITYASDITITKTETAKGVDKPEKTNKNGTGGGSSSDSSSSSKKSVSDVEITGTAVVGAKLSATTTPSAATGTYRWQKCSTKNGTYTNISGATGSSYTVVSDDEGKYIRVVFSASGKYKGTQTSTATAIGVAVVPSVKVTALAFTDTDTQASKMGGKLTWAAPTNVSNVTGYVVYASTDGTALGTKLGEVVVGTNQLVIPANTTYAAHIIVVAKNATGEAANYASVAVTDVVATATPVISGTPKAGDTTISGTCVDGATVAVSINGGAAKAATVTGTNWTITVPALVAGNTISVVATKAPNTASTAATATVVALGATNTPVISGTPKAGDTTISGTCVDGATVMVSINGGAATAATVTGTNWTITVAALAANDAISVVATKAPNTASTAATATVSAATVEVTSATITGTAQVGATLTAAANAGATNVTYKWQVCDSAEGTYTDIAGATSSTLLLAAAQEGKYIKVVINGDNASTATSAATAEVAAADPVLVEVTTATITGTAKVGETLTAAANAGATNVAYKWQVCDSIDGTYTDIAGATSSTLVLAAAQEGKYIKVVINGDNASTATSAATAEVAAADPVLVEVTTATITGTAKVGETLTAAANAGATNVTYKWQVCDSVDGTYTDIVGATSSTLVLAAAQEGKYIKVVINGDNASTTTSAATAEVAAADPVLVEVTTATITGTAKVGETLTAAANAGATNVAYKWQVCDSVDGTYTDIAGATSSTLVLAAAQEGKYIKVVINGDNSSTAASTATAAVAAATVDVTSATITGTAKVGNTLTAASNAGATNVTYKWQVCDSVDGTYTDIAGATSSTLVLAAAQEGKYIKVVINGDNASTATSTATAAVAAATVDVTTATITGTAKVGETLTAASNAGATNVTYKWQVCDSVDGTYTDIAGATSSTLVLAAAQEGKYIKVVINGDNASTATSTATAAVAAE